MHAVENSNFSLVENDDDDDDDGVDTALDKMLENFNGIATNFGSMCYCCCSFVAAAAVLVIIVIVVINTGIKLRGRKAESKA